MRAGPDRWKTFGDTLPAGRKTGTPAPVFAALGDENRLRLLARLSRGEPMSISRLTEGSGITRQGVTKHLRVLAGAGLVRSSRQGKESLWRLERRRLEEARRSLELISRQWDESLSNLKLFVESDQSS
jgi:DNA-binding transcriptional ArsR family regulator